jgi:hypothetical protein
MNETDLINIFGINFLAPLVSWTVYINVNNICFRVDEKRISKYAP